MMLTVNTFFTYFTSFERFFCSERFGRSMKAKQTENQRI